MFRWINGKNPRQYGFEFGLWTRQIVRELLVQRFGARLSLASIGALLARQGLTPQKPLQRAYQRDPDAIDCWPREPYPTIARHAKRTHAEIYFWDESGFRADAIHGKTWGACAHPPVVQVPGQRQSLSAVSAVSAKGAFWFATYAGALTGPLFVDLLRRMMRGRRKPLHLILDGLPAHKALAVKEYVAGLDGKLTVLTCPATLWISTPMSWSGAMPSAPATHAGRCRRANVWPSASPRNSPRWRATPHSSARSSDIPVLPILLPAE